MSSPSASAHGKDPNLASLLESVNWDFSAQAVVSPSEVRLFDCRRHHWYPGTFIPQIPYTLVDLLTQPLDVVWDPFGGIGTTFFQALLLGRVPYMTEVNSVAVAFTQHLLTLFDPKADLDRTRRRIATIAGEYAEGEDYSGAALRAPLVEKLRPWFSPASLAQVWYLLHRREGEHDQAVSAAMWASISAILKTCCSQDRGWGCVADNVRPRAEQLREKDVLAAFVRHNGRLLTDVQRSAESAQGLLPLAYARLSPQSNILRQSAEDPVGIPPGVVDLVVTSPPYPNMTDYCTSQRLSYYALGLDVDDREHVTDFSSEIGARRRRTRPEALAEYVEQMSVVLGEVVRRIKPGGYCCLVLPVFDVDTTNNSMRRQAVSDVVLSLSDRESMRPIVELGRVLPVRRRHHNAKWTTLERETVHVFRKE